MSQKERCKKEKKRPSTVHSKRLLRFGHVWHVRVAVVRLVWVSRLWRDVRHLVRRRSIRHRRVARIVAALGERRLVAVVVFVQPCDLLVLRRAHLSLLPPAPVHVNDGQPSDLAQSGPAWPGGKSKHDVQKADQRPDRDGGAEKAQRDGQLAGAQEARDALEARRVWVLERELAVRQRDLGRRVAGVEAVLFEARRAEVGALDQRARLVPRAVERRALQAAAEVGVGGIRVGLEAADRVCVDLVDEQPGVLRRVIELERVRAARYMAVRGGLEVVRKELTWRPDRRH